MSTVGMAGLAAAADPARAREAAREILAREPFTEGDLPRPFQGFLRRVGELVVDPVLRFFSRIGDALPEAGSPLWVALALAVVAVAAAVASRLIRDRGRERPRRSGVPVGEQVADPDQLEAQAEEAERRGDLVSALRFRFRAGLIRLDRLGALDLRPGLTNRAASRAVRSLRFDSLAAAFDEVVYGGRLATTVDVGEARAGWPVVLEEARKP